MIAMNKEIDLDKSILIALKESILNVSFEITLFSTGDKCHVHSSEVKELTEILNNLISAMNEFNRDLADN